MRLTLIPLACLLLLAGCSEMGSRHGISRSRAISIAENHCKEYPARFSEVDRAEYNDDGHFWTVALTDTYGDHGRVYKINDAGGVIGTETIDRGGREGRHDDYYGDRPYHHWGYYW